MSAEVLDAIVSLALTIPLCVSLKPHSKHSRKTNEAWVCTAATATSQKGRRSHHLDVRESKCQRESCDVLQSSLRITVNFA